MNESPEVTLAVLGANQALILSGIAKLEAASLRGYERGQARDNDISALKTACALTVQWHDEHEKRHARDGVILKTWSVVSGAIAAAVGAAAAVLRGPSA